MASYPVMSDEQIEALNQYKNAAGQAMGTALDNDIYRIGSLTGDQTSTTTTTHPGVITIGGATAQASSNYWKEREAQMDKEYTDSRIAAIRESAKERAHMALWVGLIVTAGVAIVGLFLKAAAAQVGWPVVGKYATATALAVGFVAGVRWSVIEFYRRRGETEVARFLMEKDEVR